VYFADHGGVGILGVPKGAPGGYIHAQDVDNALNTLHSKGGFKELLFYVEACYSGSIFQNLLKTPNVFAVTAANARESSYGFYCPPMDTVHGKSIGSCLGDEFSIGWMQDADVARFNSETVNQQVSKVTSEVKKSHVSKFGDSSRIGGEVIGDFEGSDGSRIMNVSLARPLDFSNSAVNSRDVEVHLAYYELHRAESIEERRDAEKALAAVLAKRATVDEKFTKIAMVAMNGDKQKAQAMIEGSVDFLNVDCHVQSLEIAANRCGAFNDYSMRHSRLFANLCESMAVAPIEAAVKQVCGGEVVV
jgi:legumain